MSVCCLLVCKTNLFDLLTDFVDHQPVSKKKKLKINIHRPMGTRVVFDDEGNALPPLARIADTQTGKEMFLLDPGMSFLFNCKLTPE